MIDLDEDQGLRPLACEMRDIMTVHITALSRIYVDSHWNILLGQKSRDSQFYYRLQNDARNSWCETFRETESRGDPREKLKGAFARSVLAGFVWYGPCRTYGFRSDDLGEIHALYVHPDYQRRGIARNLFADAAAGLKLAGYDQMMISTYRDAESANEFYRAMGCTPETGNLYRLQKGARERINYRYALNELRR